MAFSLKLAILPRAFVLMGLLLAPWCAAVNQGMDIDSDAHVPYAVGFLMKLDEAVPSPGYQDCQGGDDEALTAFCGGGLISEGVFLTAAHCFEEAANEKASTGSLNLANLRVGLGARYPYRAENGTCSGQLRGTSEGIYKVKAVFIHKAFKVISQNYRYRNARTGQTPEGDVGLDHMDVAVVLLDECARPVANSNKPRYGRIAGGKFSELGKMWQTFDSKTNTEGLPGSYWGYGQSEDDRVFPEYQINGQRAPKPVRRGNWNFNRATSHPSAAAALQRKVWPNCDWLPDSTMVWDSSQHAIDAAYTADASGTRMKASPFIACTPRNPNDRTQPSQCMDQATAEACTARTTRSGNSFCRWDAASAACAINESVVGGIGLVQYPSSGAGDSGSAVWYIENSNKLTLNDRDQLDLVHIGIVFAATKFFPAWDQTIRTDYLQNWLATVIDRDSCAAKATKAYFSGFDDSVVDGSGTTPPVSQSGWDLALHYIGQVKGVTGAVGLSQLPKRANAGSWSGSPPAPPTTMTTTTTLTITSTGADDDDGVDDGGDHGGEDDHDNGGADDGADDPDDVNDDRDDDDAKALELATHERKDEKENRNDKAKAVRGRREDDALATTGWMALLQTSEPARGKVEL